MPRFAFPLALALAALPARAAEVEVQPGDDLYALTGSLRAGDVVVFADGVYDLDGTLTWDGFEGTVDQPIELRAAPDATPILRQISGGWIVDLRNSQNVIVRGLVLEGGEGWETLGFNGMRVDSSTNVTVTDLEIRQVQYTGIYVGGDCSAIQVRHNHIHTSAEGHGIEVGCWDAGCFVQDSVFADNWIHDLVGDGSDGIRLLNGSQGNQVVDNMIHDIGDDGAYLGSTESGAANTFEGNGIWNIVDTGLYIEGASTVRNNVIARVGGYGIATNNGDRDDLDDVVITHNTVVEAGSDAVYLGDVYFRSGIVVANNAVANPIGYGLRYSNEWDDTSPPTANILRNNVVTGVVRDLPADLLDAAVIPGGGFADFADPDLLDYYPKGTATVVNAGDPSADSFVPAVDFNGVDREGNQPDAGAYEWDGDGNPGTPLQPGFKGAAAAGGAGQHDVGGGCCKGRGEGKSAILVLPLLALAGVRRRRA